MQLYLLLFLFGDQTRDLDDAFEAALNQTYSFYPAKLTELEISVVKRKVSPEESVERVEAVLSQSVLSFLDYGNSAGSGNPNTSSAIATFRVVISTGGIREGTILGDLGREEDMLVITTESFTPPGNDQSIIQRFPTLLRMSDSPVEQVADAVIRALIHLGCRKYTFVYSKEPRDLRLKRKLSNLIQALQKSEDLSGAVDTLRRKIQRFSLPVVPHEMQNESVTALTQEMQTMSTVHVLALSPENVDRLMRLSVENGLFSDRRHLLIILPAHSNDLAFQDQIETTMKVAYASGQDSSLRGPSVLVVSYGHSSSLRTTADVRTTHITNSQTSLYEAMLFLSRVLQTGTQTNLGESAKELLNTLHNQAVVGVPGLTQPVTINQEGVRVVPVAFQIYSHGGGRFENAYRYNSLDRQLDYVGLSDEKLLGLGVCNANDLDTADLSLPEQEPKTASPVAVVFGIVIGIVILTLAIRLWRRIRRFTGISWVVHENQMQFLQAHTAVIGKFVLPDMTTVRGATMLYDGRFLACCLRFPIYVSFDEVKKNTLSKLVLKLAKDLDHPNVGKFYGIMWTNADPYFGAGMVHVSEMTTRGFLRTIVDDDALALNWDLRFCLMWDLFLGIRYIHSTKLRFHGMLNSLGCFVDERFTLKVNCAGVLPYFGTLMRGKVVALPNYEYEVSTMMVNLWMAPEVRQDPRNSWTSASDMFSFGALLYEMSTRNTPFNVNLNDLHALTEFTRSMKAGTYVPCPAELELHTVPHEISALMLSCWALNTADRPKLDTIFETLTKIYPQRSGMTFSASIVDRLMHYSNELEQKVLEQTENLRAEADRVDNLLRDLLPYDIVRRLRCGETIELEQCESATVLFTDVPVFSDIVGKVTPFQLFTMLEHMCRVLDVVVAGFTVFKVETIRDSYMIVGGVPIHIGNRHAVEVANLALAMIRSVRTLPTISAFHLEEWMILEARAGIHSGPLIAGIAGTKLPHYTIFGDTVNTASRMETTGEASRVHISKATYELLKDRTEFSLTSRGLISVKGKGEVETFWMDARAATAYPSIGGFDLDEQSPLPRPRLVTKTALRHASKTLKPGSRSSAYLVP